MVCHLIFAQSSFGIYESSCQNAQEAHNLGAINAFLHCIPSRIDVISSVSLQVSLPVSNLTYFVGLEIIPHTILISISSLFFSLLNGKSLWPYPLSCMNSFASELKGPGFKAQNSLAFICSTRVIIFQHHEICLCLVLASGRTTPLPLPLLFLHSFPIGNSF